MIKTKKILLMSIMSIMLIQLFTIQSISASDAECGVVFQKREQESVKSNLRAIINTTINGIVYELDTIGLTAKVVSYNGTSRDIIVPSIINYNDSEYIVNEIRARSFYNKNLTSVIISEGIRTIGTEAFTFNNLIDVTLPTTLKVIGDYAFAINQLNSIVIPDSVTAIGSFTFSNNLLDSIVIPNSVTTIGNNAFGNNLLESIVIPNSIITIGNSCFYNNPLTEIFLPEFADIQHTLNILNSTKMSGITTPYTSMYALDNKVFDYIDGTLNHYDLDYGQTQDLAVRTYIPEIKRYDNNLETWLDHEDNPINLINEQVEWYNQSGNLVNNGYMYNANESGIFYAVINGTVRLNNISVNIKTQECIVTFDAKGGAPVPNSQKVTVGDKAIEPKAPTKEGKTFLGWYTNETYKIQWDFNAPVTSDLTLYARWDISEYTVIFDSKGGNPVPTSQKVMYGDKVVEPKVPTQVGKTFLGWYTDETYKTQWDYNAVVTSDLTLYARWNTNEYNVVFEPKGGNPVPTSQKVMYGNKVVEPKAPTQEGKTFLGWYTDETYKTQWDFDALVTSDLTLYARWNVPEATNPTDDTNSLPITGDASTPVTGGVMLLVGAFVLSIGLLIRRKVLQ